MAGLMSSLFGGVSSLSVNKNVPKAGVYAPTPTFFDDTAEQNLDFNALGKHCVRYQSILSDRNSELSLVD